MMKLVRLKNIVIGRFSAFDPYHEVTHFITTRAGGFSNHAYEGLNLGFGTDDDPKLVTQNRYLLAEELGIPLDWFVFPRQTHTNHVFRVEEADRGRGALDRESAIPHTDALITKARHTCIVVQVADCVPLLIFDPVQRAIAVVHAGWRGTVQKIAEQTIQSMQQHFGSDPANLMAAIGPSIQSCCYEVGDDVYRAFSETNHPLHLIFSRNYNKLWLNLPLANQLQLTGAGVKPENISVAPYCTRCHSDLFYSSRSNRGITGRFVAGMMLW